MRPICLIATIALIAISCNVSNNVKKDFKKQPPDSCFTIIKHCIGVETPKGFFPETIAFKYIADVSDTIQVTKENGDVVPKIVWHRDSAYRIPLDSLDKNNKPLLDSLGNTVFCREWKWIPKTDKVGNRTVIHDYNMRIKF